MFRRNFVYFWHYANKIMKTAVCIQIKCLLKDIYKVVRESRIANENKSVAQNDLKKLSSL